jgi:pyruvate/2-oxoglutarate dehydrogenase complex dihydrolipoamide acyltransferase (E2) component
MLYQLQVPGVVPDVAEVRVLQWHAAAGQTIAPGELMVEVETHKAVVEIRADQAGTLRTVLVAEGEWQVVGMPLAVLSDAHDEPLPADPAELTSLAVSFEIT